MEYFEVGAFLLGELFGCFFGRKSFRKSLRQRRQQNVQPLLKGFEVRHTEGASAVSSALAGSNNTSVRGILLTSCFA